MELRPQYHQEFSLAAEDAIARLSFALKQEASPVRGRVVGNKVEIMCSGDTHFWSPELRGRILEHGDGQSRLRSRFTPHQNTWTMFLAIYAGVIFSTGIGATFGLAQLTLKHNAWALWSIPIGIILIALVWLGARIGQSLGSDEMQVLKDFVRDSIANSSFQDSRGSGDCAPENAVAE